MASGDVLCHRRLMPDALPADEASPEFTRDALVSMDAVYRFARSLSRDEANADDLVQETYLRAFRAWQTFVVGSDMRRWLFAICHNVFLRTREREQRYEPLQDAEGETLRAVERHAEWRRDGTDALIQQLDLQSAVERALAVLSEPFRTVVILVDLQDASYEEASGILGVPIGTVRSRLFRGRRLLQEHLMDQARDAGLAGGQDG